MGELKIGVFDVETQETSVLTVSGKEAEAILKQNDEDQKFRIEMESKIEAARAEKESKRAALLSKLGITEEEAKLLLG